MDDELFAACAAGLGATWGLLDEPSERVDDFLSAAHWLFREYEHGRIHGALLARLALPLGSPDQLALGAAVNQLVCVEVAAGRYREALTWRARAFPDAPVPAELDPLLRVNEAEALANLGRWGDALTWPTPPHDAQPWVASALAAHRAWVLCGLGRPSEARAALGAQRTDQLPAAFQSEWHFSHFSLALCEHQFGAAAAALASAERLQVRASTKRNVVFCKGLLEHARENHRDAATHFAEGARLEYQGQGGEALLAWGDSLRALGRATEAGDAYALCSERDPQSPAAAVARTRTR